MRYLRWAILALLLLMALPPPTPVQAQVEPRVCDVCLSANWGNVPVHWFTYAHAFWGHDPSTWHAGMEWGTCGAHGHVPVPCYSFGLMMDNDEDGESAPGAFLKQLASLREATMTPAEYRQFRERWAGYGIEFNATAITLMSCLGNEIVELPAALSST